RDPPEPGRLRALVRERERAAGARLQPQRTQRRRKGRKGYEPSARSASPPRPLRFRAAAPPRANPRQAQLEAARERRYKRRMGKRTDAARVVAQLEAEYRRGVEALHGDRKS